MLFSRSLSSSHAPQLNGNRFTLLISHFLASSSVLLFASTIPYKYSSHPWLLPSRPLAARSANQTSRLLARSTSCLLIEDVPSAGPKIISLSSSFRFSPDMYFAYSARNNDRWLTLGSESLEKISSWLEPAGPFFDFPFCELVGVLVWELENFSVGSPRDVSAGRNTAAQRSYSLQSK